MSKEAHKDKELSEFCDRAIGVACLFYDLTKTDFEQMLQKGYSEIKFGRGPFGYVDEKDAEYIVAFAAFSQKESREIVTFELRKNADFFGSITQGISVRRYTPDEFKKTVDRFRLSLVSEDLTSFINRFPWPKQSSLTSTSF